MLAQLVQMIAATQPAETGTPSSHVLESKRWPAGSLFLAAVAETPPPTPLIIPMLSTRHAVEMSSDATLRVRAITSDITAPGKATMPRTAHSTTSAYSALLSDSHPLLRFSLVLSVLSFSVPCSPPLFGGAN